jgi:hypothetical protein
VRAGKGQPKVPRLGSVPPVKFLPISQVDLLLGLPAVLPLLCSGLPALEPLF